MRLRRECRVSTCSREFALSRVEGRCSHSGGVPIVVCGSSPAARVRLPPKRTMTWIPIVPRADADPALEAAYDDVSGARGTVANIMGVHSVHPAAMTAHLRLYQEVMFAPSEMTRVEREIVAVAVSRANDCFY
jgi:hypothetical protein